MTDELNRRDFAGMLAALLGSLSLLGANAEAQAAAGMAGTAAAPVHELKELSSGVFRWP